jgi:hypothetical protein
MVRISVTSLMGLVVLFALYLMGKGTVNLRRAFASPKWPKTTGVVVGADAGTSVAQDRNTRTTFYSAKTTIRYAVDGKAYTTSWIHFGQTFGSSDPSVAALQLLRYPIGANVPVSYDPGAPQIAAVRPGIHAEAFWLVGAGLAFLLPAIMCLVVLPAMLDDTGAGHGSPFAFAAGIFGAIFCALGILGLSIGLQRLWNGHASQTWPTAQGEVVSATMSENRVHIGSEAGHPEDDPRTGGAVPASTYSVGFVYRYEVNGTAHYNNQRRFGAYVGSDSMSASRTARIYPVGSKVTVAFYPTDPDVSTVETGIDNEAYALPGFGAGGILFGIAVLIWIVPLARSM